MDRMKVEFNFLDCVDQLEMALTYLHALHLAINGIDADFREDANALDRIADDCQARLERVRTLLEEGRSTARKAT
ncbi:hypothetical protein [Rhizobium sp. BE258]|uniref:hypothetical protein n=1 Tax=Rhizobium sp. BE258 TaxID=2817722 RepID=UPI00285ACA91|nr:hypothetical protein [Rhizobium sp. BE258]MDR7146181.1 hypothetical protein [Rhizobium sp. BE258]